MEIFTFDFMIRAFLAGAVIAIIAPLIGSFLVIRRFSLVADTLSHIALAGVAISLLTHTQPLITTVVITILASFLIDKVRSSKNIPGDVVLAMFLPGGLALSVVLIGLANGFNASLFSYLFGSITTVTPREVYLIVILGIISIATIFILYKQLLFTAFDEDSARISGIKVEVVNLILMILTAVTVSLSMRVVGVLLIGALMVIPITASMQIAKSFKNSLILATIIALTALVSGLFIAYYLNLPAGGAIVLVSLAIFALVSFLKPK